MMRSIFHRHKESFYFGLSLAVLLLFIKWVETRFVLFPNTLQLYIFILALLFTIIGYWIAKRMEKPKVTTIVLEKKVYLDPNTAFEFDQQELDRRKITKRELEVLILIAAGKSNQEIADQLYVSLATIKTHTANLFEKLEAKRRTQAIEYAKKLHLIP